MAKVEDHITIRDQEGRCQRPTSTMACGGRVLMIEIIVYGIPAPQGSKRFVGMSKAGRGILIESSAKVKPWRQAVTMAAVESEARVVGPVSVSMVFTLPRPAAAKKRAHHATKPDLSKLVRSTEDSITDAGLWEDDSRVCRTTSEKLYVGAEGALASPGAVIVITPLTCQYSVERKAGTL